MNKSKKTTSKIKKNSILLILLFSISPAKLLAAPGTQPSTSNATSCQANLDATATSINFRQPRVKNLINSGSTKTVNLESLPLMYNTFCTTGSGTCDTKPWSDVAGYGFQMVGLNGHSIPQNYRCPVKGEEPKQTQIPRRIYLTLGSNNTGTCYYSYLATPQANGNFKRSDIKVHTAPENPVNLCTNQRPTADAGINQTVSPVETITLNGTGNDTDIGQTIGYEWIPPSGITLSNNLTSNPTFTAPSVTTDTNLEFKLIVNDGYYESEADTVIITIKAPTTATDINTKNIPIFSPLGLLLLLIGIIWSQSQFKIRATNFRRDTSYKSAG